MLDAIVIDATNPFNPFGVDLDSTNTDLIYRRFIEGGPRRFNQTVDTVYATATLDGRIDLGGTNWYWTSTPLTAATRPSDEFGNINSDRLRHARPGGDLLAPCVRSTSRRIRSTPRNERLCHLRSEGQSEQKDLDFANCRHLFELPAGPLECRRIHYRNCPPFIDPSSRWL